MQLTAKCLPALIAVDYFGRREYNNLQPIKISLWVRIAMNDIHKKPYTEVVAALIWDNDRFLICQRPANKARGLLWEFVGGKVEKGESKQEALIRECREELAIDIAADTVFTEVTHDYPDITVHLTLFNSRIVGGQLTLLEHNAMAWITPREMENYQFCPADEVILQKIKLLKSKK